MTRCFSTNLSLRGAVQLGAKGRQSNPFAMHYRWVGDEIASTALALCTALVSQGQSGVKYQK